MKRGLIVGALLVATASAPVAGRTTAPGKNGLIAYSQPWGVFVVKPDGTGKLELAKSGVGADVGGADWSPDGTRIAYNRCKNNGPCRIWVVNPDGSGLRPLGPAADDRGSPAWSPDGRSIAYSRVWGGVQNDQIKFAEIYVMSAGGTGPRQITRVTADASFSADVDFPAWSPDGKRLAFEVHNSKTGTPASRRAIFTINADGSGVHQLTDWSLNGSNPDWSPDGRLIVFRSVSPTKDQHGNLYTIHPDGTGLKRLTSYGGVKTVEAGSFSPDGQWIVFSRFTGVSSYPAIYAMRRDGSGLRRVTKDDANFEPDWGPAR
jgi:TolB protein